MSTSNLYYLLKLIHTTVSEAIKSMASSSAEQSKLQYKNIPMELKQSNKEQINWEFDPSERELRKNISFSEKHSLMKEKQKEQTISQKETGEPLMELGLDSRKSKESIEPSIHINKQQSQIQKYRKYQKVLISSYSKTHPSPDTDHEVLAVQIKDVDEEPNEQKRSGGILRHDKENEPIEMNHYKLSKPQVVQGKKISLQLNGQSDFLIPDTDSMLMNSVNSHQESLTHQVVFNCKGRSSNQSDKNERTLKGNQQTKQKMGVANTKNTQEHFHAKSQKKVTFIGDSSMRVQEDEIDEKQNWKSETQNSFKDDSSTTSILHQRPCEKRSKVQQSSRKIISQDQNYCLFRLMGFKKSEKHLMCRSVEIKDETTEYKQLKLYLLCRQNQHNNIVKMHSYEKVVRDNKIFIEIKMDYYPKNLEEYVLESKKMEKKANIERKIILFQILKVLNYIHSKGICHRDLNPHSIFIGESLETAVSNFAYTKQTSNLYSNDHFYQSNFFIRPPEVILQPSRQFEKGGDIWSFGCIVVYMLKGEMPFFKVSDAELMIEIIRILGSPSKQYLDSINFKDYKRFIFPKTYRKPIDQAFRCQDSQLLSLLRRIFVYRVEERPSAATLMASNYFKEIKEQETFKILSKTYELSTLFDFAKSIDLLMKMRSRIIEGKKQCHLGTNHISNDLFCDFLENNYNKKGGLIIKTMKYRSEEQTEILEDHKSIQLKQIFQFEQIFQNQANIDPGKIGLSIVIFGLFLWFFFAGFFQEMLHFHLSSTYLQPTIGIPRPSEKFNSSTVSQTQKYTFQQTIASFIEPFNDTSCQLINFGSSVLCENLIKKSVALLNIGFQMQDTFGCHLSEKYEIFNYFYGCQNHHFPLCSLPKTYQSLKCIGQYSESVGSKIFISLSDVIKEHQLEDQPKILKMVVKNNWDAFISMPNRLLSNIDQLVLQFHIEQAYQWGTLDIFATLDSLFYPVNTHMNNQYCYNDSLIKNQARKLQSSVFQVTYVRKNLVNLHSNNRSFRVNPVNVKKGKEIDCHMPLSLTITPANPIIPIQIPSIEHNLHSFTKEHLHLKEQSSVPTLGVPILGNLFNDIAMHNKQISHFHDYIAKTFKPYSDTNCQYARYGGDEGEFIVCKNLISVSVALISAGIDEKDVFGCQLTTQFKIPNYQYGCTGTKRPFCRTNNGGNSFTLACLNERSQYFKQEDQYFYSLKDIIDSRKLNNQHIILKIDGAGTQWSALRSFPLSYLEFIDQIVMKVHLDSRAYLKGNINIVQSLQEHFIPVNLHMNNLGCSDQGILSSTIFEVTLVNKNILEVNSQSRSFTPNALNKISSSEHQDCQVKVTSNGSDGD